jgi:hypothetical protein
MARVEVEVDLLHYFLCSYSDDTLEVTPNTGPFLYFSRVSYPLLSLSLFSSNSLLSSLQLVWRWTSMAMVCKRPLAQRH